MTTRSLDRSLAVLAALSAATVVFLVVTIVTTRSTQDFFQTARTAEAYVAYLATPLASLGLRIGLGLDNLFMRILRRVLRPARRSHGRLCRQPPSDGRAGRHAVDRVSQFSREPSHHYDGPLDPERATGIRRRRPVSNGRVADQVSQQLSGRVAVFVWLSAIRQTGPHHRVRAVGLHPVRDPRFRFFRSSSARTLVLGRTVFFIAAFILSAVLFFRQSKAVSQSGG